MARNVISVHFKRLLFFAKCHINIIDNFNENYVNSIEIFENNTHSDINTYSDSFGCIIIMNIQYSSCSFGCIIMVYIQYSSGSFG